MRNLKPFSHFVFFFVLACERSFIKKRSIENRCYRTGKYNTGCRHIRAPFSPGNFTSCDSEGVKHPVDLLYCCSRPDGPLPGPASGGGSGGHQHAAVPLRLQPGPAAPAHGAAGGRAGQHQDGGAERAVQGLFAHHHEPLAHPGGSGQGGATGSRGTETGGWMLGGFEGRRRGVLVDWGVGSKWMVVGWGKFYRLWQ